MNFIALQFLLYLSQTGSGHVLILLKRMECGSGSSTFGGGMALLCGKGLISTPKMVPFKVSFNVKSECLGLGFLHSLRVYVVLKFWVFLLFWKNWK